MRRTRPEGVHLPTDSPTLSRRTSTRAGSGPGVVYHRKSSLSLSSASSFQPNASPFSDDIFPRPNSTSTTAATTNNSTTSALVGANIQRTIEALHHIRGQIIQPTLDKARYKAEAGLSKRGYVRNTTAAAAAAGESTEFDAAEAEEQASLTRTPHKWLDADFVDAGFEDAGVGEPGGWERGRAFFATRPAEFG